MTMEPTVIDDAYEVMDLVLHRGDARMLACDLGLSPSTIRAWCQVPCTEEEFGNHGRLGPLQRLDRVIDFVLAQDHRPDRAYPVGHHVARRLKGLFVPLPLPACSDDSEMLSKVCSVLKEVGQGLEVTRVAWMEESPGVITARERKKVLLELEEAMHALARLYRWVDEAGRAKP